MGSNLRTKYVGMDVHQKSISITIADGGPNGEVRLYGTTKNTAEAVDKVIKICGLWLAISFYYFAPCKIAGRNN